MKDLTPQQIYDYNHYSAFFTTEQIQSLNKAQTKKFYPVNIKHIQYLTTDYLTTNQIKSYSNHFTGKQISQFNEEQTQNFFPSYPQRIESRYNFSINQIPYLKTEYLSPRQVLDYYDLLTVEQVNKLTESQRRWTPRSIYEASRNAKLYKEFKI